MNKYIVNGNIVRDIDLRFMEGTGKAVLRNTIASKRKYKNAQEKYDSDFIPFVAFGKTAEFIANNFVKGQGIQLECRVQSGDYTKDGVKHYTLEAIVESVEFHGGKKADNSQQDTFGGGMSFEDDMTPVDSSDIPF